MINCFKKTCFFFQFKNGQRTVSQAEIFNVRSTFRLKTICEKQIKLKFP